MAGKREGTVPARVRRTEFDAESEPGLPADAWPASKSGKLSLPGDSGIVSRSGVECPLPVVGGPQICGDNPSCCCISRALARVSFVPIPLALHSSVTYRLGNKRLPYSLDGEPAPARPVPDWLLLLPRPLPNGYRVPDPAGGSIGELACDVFAERVWPMLMGGRPSRLRW